MARSPKRDDLDEQILSVIGRNAFLSEDKIARVVDRSRNTVVKRLKALIQAGQVLPKGYYLAPREAPRRKISRYVFIVYPGDIENRGKLLQTLRAYSAKFPFVRVTSPYDYIAFVPADSSGRENDEFITELINAGAVLHMSSLTGDPPAESPELPNRDER